MVTFIVLQLADLTLPKEQSTSIRCLWYQGCFLKNNFQNCDTVNQHRSFTRSKSIHLPSEYRIHLNTRQYGCPVFKWLGRPFKYWTFWQPDTNLPFKYCIVHRGLAQCDNKLCQFKCWFIVSKMSKGFLRDQFNKNNLSDGLKNISLLMFLSSIKCCHVKPRIILKPKYAWTINNIIFLLLRQPNPSKGSFNPEPLSFPGCLHLKQPSASYVLGSR